IEGRRTIAASSFFPERSRQVPNRSYSLEKAKESLKKSTYNGETVHIYFFAFKDGANDAHFLKERCEQLGIRVELHPFLVSDYMDCSI
ncbi:SgrR family transcriptional regulator, partial [Bacillus thuringiensis]